MTAKLRIITLVTMILAVISANGETLADGQEPGPSSSNTVGAPSTNPIYLPLRQESEGLPHVCTLQPMGDYLYLSLIAMNYGSPPSSISALPRELIPFGQKIGSDFRNEVKIITGATKQEFRARYEKGELVVETSFRMGHLPEVKGVIRFKTDGSLSDTHRIDFKVPETYFGLPTSGVCESAPTS